MAAGDQHSLGAGRTARSPEWGHCSSPPRRDQLYENVITTTSRILRTEVSMFHCGLRVAGQADCLCTDPAGNIVIWDWKRSKEIRFDGQQQMKPPFLPPAAVQLLGVRAAAERLPVHSGEQKEAI